jgi:hypothetical protein
VAARLDALLAIGSLLAPKAKTLAAGVTQAFEDPAAYLAAHAKRMDDRSIDEPQDNLPWIALIDALGDARVLAEIDWKFGGEDIAYNLEQLRGFPKRAVKWLRALDENDDRSTLELLEVCGQRLLAEQELQLAHIDMDSDSYCLVAIPAASAGRLVALAKRARYGQAVLFTGKGLAAAKREREALEKRDRERAARDAKRKEPEVGYYARGKATWWIRVAPLAFDTCYETPSVKYFASHYGFKRAKDCAARAREQVAAWEEEGFESVDEATFTKLARSTTAYIGWTGPFPKDARYYVENKRIIRCIAQRGDALWSSGGVLGKDFAELQSFTHFKSSELAAKAVAAEIARHDSTSFYKPIERAELIARYKQAR